MWGRKWQEQLSLLLQTTKGTENYLHWWGYSGANRMDVKIKKNVRVAKNIRGMSQTCGPQWARVELRWILQVQPSPCVTALKTSTAPCMPLSLISSWWNNIYQDSIKEDLKEITNIPNNTKIKYLVASRGSALYSACATSSTFSHGDIRLIT